MYQALLTGGVLDMETGTVTKRDMSSHEWLAYLAWLKAGNTPLPPDAPVVPIPTVDEIIAAVTLSTQKRLDDFAKTRNYDGILSACTYASSTMPNFAAEGQYAVEARDATWAALYTVMAEVQLGTRPMPTGISDVEPLLPALIWPV